MKVLAPAFLALLLFVIPVSALDLPQASQQNDISVIDVHFKNTEGWELAATIYCPPGGGKHPAIVFCGGWCSQRSMYSWIGEGLAQRGYIAMLLDPTATGDSEGVLPDWTVPFSENILGIPLRPGAAIEGPLRLAQGVWRQDVWDAIDYLLNQSPVREMVDESRIGIAGHSFGGVAVTSTPLHPKVKAVVALSDVNPATVGELGELGVPLQIQTGDFDILINDQLNPIPCYRLAKPPKELIVIAGGTHDGFSNLLYGYYPAPPWQREVSMRYMAAWFDYFLKGDTSALGTLTSWDKHLSRLHLSCYNFGDGEHYLLPELDVQLP